MPCEEIIFFKIKIRQKISKIGTKKKLLQMSINRFKNQKKKKNN